MNLISLGPTCILANLVSKTIAAHCPETYTYMMAAVTPRKVWLARPGDGLVFLAPISKAFQIYVERTIGIDYSSLEIVAPSKLYAGHPLDLADELAAIPRILNYPIILPFVLDRRRPRRRRSRDESP